MYPSTHCTLEAIKRRNDNIGDADDALIAAFIRAASEDITTACNDRYFVPYDAARLYDWTPYRELDLDADLLSLVSVTDSVGAREASTYVLEGANVWPKRYIRLKNTASAWAYEDDPAQSIEVVGVFGFHRNPLAMWRSVGATLNGEINASVTTLTLNAENAAIETLSYLKIGDEYLQVTGIAEAVLTVERGVNGSTAALHATSSPVLLYKQTDAIREATEQYTVYLYNNRDKTGEDRIQILNGTVTVSNPTLDSVKTLIANYKAPRKVYSV